MIILYLAHDLDDTAIWRRTAMLVRGGAEVCLSGFRRGTAPIQTGVGTEGVGEPQVLGLTENGKLGKRLLSVLRLAAATMAGQGVDVRRVPDVIVARNLEMLALALVLRLRIGAVPVVYEVLDIHRIMLGRSAKAVLLRAVERAMLRRCRMVILSSPAFERNYLTPLQKNLLPVVLVENKPLAFAMPAPDADKSPRGLGMAGPLTIGWFGILRCQWSLECLDRLTKANPGKFRVVMRGKPALDVLGDFHRTVDQNPDLTFEGPYVWPDDLARIYGSVDLAWLIDRYDAGGNSDWLLPNRLYEAAGQGAVPVVVQGTEVATRVSDPLFGVIVPEATERSVAACLLALDGERLGQLQARLAGMPASDWVADDAECAGLVAAFAAVRGPKVVGRVVGEAEALP